LVPLVLAVEGAFGYDRALIDQDNMNRSLASIVVGLLATCVSVARADLTASAGCQGGRVVIINRDSADWLDVKIQVNSGYIDSGYVHETAAIPKGSTMRFFPSIFTKSDGTRLNLDNIACKTIDVHAYINGKREHWNGAYK
jgi:hypothetical protein